MNKIILILLGIVVSLGILDFVIPKEHTAFHLEAIPGFYAFFGFLATGLIIVVSKVVGWLVTKKEDYYDA